MGLRTLPGPSPEHLQKNHKNLHFWGAPGTPNGRPKAPQNQKKQVRHDICSHSFLHRFSTTGFITFGHLSGCLEPRQGSKNVVLSFKIEGTTLSRKNLILSKIPPKVTPQATPETIQNKKNTYRTPSENTLKKNNNKTSKV